MAAWQLQPNWHRRCNNIVSMNLSGYVKHVTIFSCYGHDCVLLVVGLGLVLELGLDEVSA